jgi:iron complex transport system substrate-binding protein
MAMMLRVALVMLGVLAVVPRASVAAAPAPNPGAALTLVDDTGAHVTLSKPPLRIISLAPSATEMLFTAGAGDRLVATVNFSDEPAAAKLIPRIGDVTGVDMERLVALRPDIVVVWPGGGNPAQIDKITQLGIPVYRQQVNRLADMPASVRRLGALAADPSVSERAARALEDQLHRIAREYASGPHPGVMLEVWNRPIYTVGGTQLMSDALTLCGGRNVFGDLKELSAAVDIEAVIARNPDIIVAAAPVSEGKGWLEDWRRFGSLSAVRSGRLIAFEDSALVRMGPSVLGATERLCKALAAAEGER